MTLVLYLYVIAAYTQRHDIIWQLGTILVVIVRYLVLVGLTSTK